MVSASFVMSAYTIKNQQSKRVINYRQTALRYFVVLIACLVVFGCEYCFDTPSALQDYIEHNQEQANDGQQMGQTKFNLLYSLYSLPNIIVPLIGGILIDSKGPRLVLVLTAAICVFGQVVFGIGGFKNMFSIMLVGRFIFGIGGEVLHASQNTLISRWFKSTQLSMVLGICISVPKLGSSLNAVLSPSIAQIYNQRQQGQDDYLNVGLPLLVGLFMMIFSLLMAFLLFYIDRKSEKQQIVNHQSKILSKKQPPKKTSLKKIANSHQQIISKSSTQQLASPLTVVMQLQSTVNQSRSIMPEGGSHFNLKQIRKLPITYWLLLLVAMLTQALFIPFLDNGNKYFVTVYKQIHKPEDAGTYLILPYVVSSIAVIPMGYVVDKIKNRGYVIIWSCVFILFTYMFMMYVETDASLRDSTVIPWVPVFLLGICVAIFCTVIVPTVPMIVPPNLMGSGFGMMEMLQNLALCVFPLLAGFIRQTQSKNLEGFHLQSLFFFLIACFCLSAAILLQAVDRLKGNKLKQKDFKKTYINKYMRE